jgi:hypothetical protein
VLEYLGVNFSGYHENRGKGRRSTEESLAADEMLRLDHYGLSTGGVIEKLPLLRAFIKKGETVLQNVDAPAPWHEAIAIFDEALALGNHPPEPGTAYPVTQRQWEEGHDPDAPCKSGKLGARSPQQKRPIIMGIMVKGVSHRHRRSATSVSPPCGCHTI